LSLEKVDNNAIIPPHIPFPARSSKFHELQVIAAIPIWFFDVRFLKDAVEVLMQSVQEEGDELLGIVLLIPGELRREAR
jgi:hypothetical protein